MDQVLAELYTYINKFPEQTRIFIMGYLLNSCIKPEYQVRIAGYILEEVGINEESFKEFWKQLSLINKTKLIGYSQREESN